MSANPDLHVRVHLGEQSLSLLDGTRRLLEFGVSTAANGPGELRDSGCTPRGHHVVRAMIGNRAPLKAVFVGRRPTGEVYRPELRRQHPGRDWILTRILWLSGTEPGRNRLGDVDTMRRYIYIHGCPDELPMGAPDSHGCIRMRNEEVITLFDRLRHGTRIHIVE